MAATMAATAANSDFPTFLIGLTFNFQIYANSSNLYHSSLPKLLSLNAAALWPFPTPVPPPVPPSEGGTEAVLPSESTVAVITPSEGVAFSPYFPTPPKGVEWTYPLPFLHTERAKPFQPSAHSFTPSKGVAFSNHLITPSEGVAFSTVCPHLPKAGRKYFAENLVYKINQFIFAP